MLRWLNLKNRPVLLLLFSSPTPNKALINIISNFQELETEKEKSSAQEKELQELRIQIERHNRVSKLLMEEVTGLKNNADKDREMAETYVLADKSWFYQDSALPSTICQRYTGCFQTWPPTGLNRFKSHQRLEKKKTYSLFKEALSLP